MAVLYVGNLLIMIITPCDYHDNYDNQIILAIQSGSPRQSKPLADGCRLLFKEPFPARHTGCGQRRHNNRVLALSWYRAKHGFRKDAGHTAGW